jgi:hypothetical protein
MKIYKLLKINQLIKNLSQAELYFIKFDKLKRQVII